MLSLQTSSVVQQAISNLNNAQSRVGRALERVSSGQRVNSAADDAAGSSIANRMTADLRADAVLTRGISDGIGLMQVAEGGLDGINSLLQRSRELAVQAASDTLADSDRAALNTEYKQLRAEIDRLSRSTTAFGKFPLAPAPTTTLPATLGSTAPLSAKFPVSGSSSTFSSGVVSMAYVPSGAQNFTLTIDSLGADDDIQLFSRSGEHLVGTPLEGANADIVWQQNGITDAASADAKALTTANGFLPGASYSAANLLQGGASYDLNGSATASYNGMTLTYSGDGDRYETATTGGYNDGRNGAQRLERLTIDQTTEDLLIMVVGQGAFTATATWDAMPTPTVPAVPVPPYSTPTEILLGAPYGGVPDSVTIEPTPADSASLGLSDVELDPVEKAREALAKLQQAMNTVDGYRSQYGALTNRFDGAIDGLGQQSLATTAARSRIVDADYALEVSALTRGQILQQAGTSVLTQANKLPEGILALLR